VRRFELLEPNSVEEACRLLSKHGEGAKVLAGGTALVKLMKKKLIHPSYLVNIKGIKELHFIREDKVALKIGALTPLREIETSPIVRDRLRVVTEMVTPLVPCKSAMWEPLQEISALQIPPQTLLHF
jgi:CO/xanthine dehydrogenase FAD-binding subunit